MKEIRKGIVALAIVKESIGKKAGRSLFRFKIADELMKYLRGNAFVAEKMEKLHELQEFARKILNFKELIADIIGCEEEKLGRKMKGSGITIEELEDLGITLLEEFLAEQYGP